MAFREPISCILCRVGPTPVLQWGWGNGFFTGTRNCCTRRRKGKRDEKSKVYYHKPLQMEILSTECLSRDWQCSKRLKAGIKLTRYYYYHQQQLIFIELLLCLGPCILSILYSVNCYNGPMKYRYSLCFYFTE